MSFLNALQTAKNIVARTDECAYVYHDSVGNHYQVASMRWDQLLPRWQVATKAIVAPTGAIFYAQNFTIPTK